MPRELVDKIMRAKNFNQGFGTVEYLSAALIDMKLHLADAGPIDAARFEQGKLAALGMPEEIVMRHRLTQFAHVFAGDEYSAGYYSYLWSDALTADAWEAFGEGRLGAWDPVVAARYRKEILSRGNSLDQAVEFRNFRGRDVDTAALMRDRGFAPPRTKLGGT
jgi:peptidyl-dipeptidase Dcp